jgi:hypothetical protein
VIVPPVFCGVVVAADAVVVAPLPLVVAVDPAVVGLEDGLLLPHAAAMNATPSRTAIVLPVARVFLNS